MTASSTPHAGRYFIGIEQVPHAGFWTGTGHACGLFLISMIPLPSGSGSPTTHPHHQYCVIPQLLQGGSLLCVLALASTLLPDAVEWTNV